MAGTTIGGFELTVHDLDGAVGFYTQVFGLSVRAREDHDIFQEVRLAGDDDTSSLILVSPRDPDAPPAITRETSKIVLIMDDVPARYARALAAGATEVQAPEHFAPLDLWFAHVRDPAGYTVQMVGRHGPNATGARESPAVTAEGQPRPG